jgi:acetylornithine deacetylase/succinyl-diaminopimelate desuccinylase-like protein
MLDKKELVSFAESQRSGYEKLLEEFIGLRTVSSDPECNDEIYRCAELAVDVIKQSGGDAEIFSGKGQPIVYGGFHIDERLPTVTIYNHLDVQPASRETEPWETEPFRMTKSGERYFGRGTTDDKGPALAALFGARAARDRDIPVNIKFLWEFEEEIGSPNFEHGIKSIREKLKTQSVVVSDTIWVSRKRPACPAGLRGLQGLRFTLQTGTTDQHSGTTGGAARNPLGELMKLISEIYDAGTGKVKVPGFYDDVVKPTKREIEDFRNSGFSVSAFKKDHLLKSLRTDDALEVMKRIWALPTFEIHGMTGGYTGPKIKTIVPPFAEVKASCRLVPNQDPAKIVRLIKEFVRERNRDVVVHVEGTLAPYQGTTTGPYADSVKRAMKFAFGREPVFVREGGSIGAVITMEKILKCPVMFLGLSLPEHGYHAPNENFDWQQASGGMVAFASYFEEISKIK